MIEKQSRASLTRSLRIAIGGLALVCACKYLGFVEGINPYFYDAFLRLRSQRTLTPANRYSVSDCMHEGSRRRSGCRGRIT